MIAKELAVSRAVGDVGGATRGGTVAAACVAADLDGRPPCPCRRSVPHTSSSRSR